MAKKKMIFSDNSGYEKKYKRLCRVLVVVLLLFAGFVYMNYDYLVFKFLISYNYAYTEVLDEIYTQSLGEENVKGYFKNFDSTVIAVVTEKIRETAGDRYTYLYTPKQYTVSKEYTKSQASEAEIRELSGDTVYINIPNISKYTRKYLEENKAGLNAYENIVIDLRSNSGGKLNDMYKMAGMFLEKGSSIGYEVTRSSLTSSHAKATKKQYFQFENIIILQNGQTASAAEGFIMALKENLDNVTLMGTTSFGKGIGQVTIPIKRGFAVKATVLLVETPERNSIHNEGIAPDINYEEEDILDEVLNYIAGSQ